MSRFNEALSVFETKDAARYASALWMRDVGAKVKQQRIDGVTRIGPF